MAKTLVIMVRCLRSAVVRLIGIAAVSCLLVAADRGLAQPEQVLGAELCDAAQGGIPAGSRIALAPPQASESPVPVAEIEAIMSRAAQAMCADWAEKPRILAGSAELRASLALVQARQGAEAWRQTVQATVRQEADFVLVGEVGMSASEVFIRLTLVDLSDGRVLVKTSDAPLGSVSRQVAGDPRAAIGEAVRQFLDLLPESRQEVTVGRFVNEASGLETALGKAMSDMAVEAWLDAANSVTALLRDAPPARVRIGERPAQGFYLAGTIRLVDRDRFQLTLRLSQDRALRATRTLDLSALQLPSHLRALLDPQANAPLMSLAEVEEAVSVLGPGEMSLAASGGFGGVYPVCRATSAARVPVDCTSSLIRLDLLAQDDGTLLCLSLDEHGQFYVMLPGDYAPRTRLTAGQVFTLPDDLPPLPDGNRVYWPAMGPAAETLVACLLYPVLAGTTLDSLAAVDGTRISPRERAALVAVLRDSAPRAAAAVRVRIVD